MLEIVVKANANVPVTGDCPALCAGCTQRVEDQDPSVELSGRVVLGRNIGITTDFGGVLVPTNGTAGQGTVKVAASPTGNTGTYGFTIQKNGSDFKNVVIVYNGDGELSSIKVNGVETTVVDSGITPGSVGNPGLTIVDEYPWYGSPVDNGRRPRSASYDSPGIVTYSIKPGTLSTGRITGPAGFDQVAGWVNGTYSWVDGQNPVDISNKELTLTFHPPTDYCTENTITE